MSAALDTTGRARALLAGKLGLSARTVARLLDLPFAEVERMCTAGELRARRLGSSWCIDPASVRKLLPWLEPEEPERRKAPPRLDPRIQRRLYGGGS